MLNVSSWLVANGCLVAFVTMDKNIIQYHVGEEGDDDDDGVLMRSVTDKCHECLFIHPPHKITIHPTPSNPSMTHVCMSKDQIHRAEQLRRKTETD